MHSQYRHLFSICGEEEINQPEDPERFDKTHALAIGTGGSRVQVGELVGGAYRLESLLGQGGMGYVFRARHITIDQIYALKIINPDALDAISARRFAAEARVIAKLNHAHIVKIFNMGVHNQSCPFYVMELLDGRPLSEYIHNERALGLAQGLDIFVQVAQGQIEGQSLSFTASQLAMLVSTHINEIVIETADYNPQELAIIKTYNKIRIVKRNKDRADDSDD